MIESLRGSLGFLFPWLVVLAPLVAAALIYVYLRRGRGRRVTVPTLLLLRTLERASPARKKFVPPWRFFYELVLLLLLTAGAAGIYLRGEQIRVAVLLDNSMSMNAVSPSQGTLLESAKEELHALLDTLPSDAEVFPYVTSPDFRSLAAEGVHPAEAAQRFAEVTAMAAADNLDLALSRLVSRARYDRVVAFSDKRIAKGNQSSVVVEGRMVGGALANISLSNVVVRDGAQPKIAVVVDNFGGESVTLNVVIERLDLDSLRFREMTRQPLTLRSGEQRELALSVSENNVRAGRVRLEIPAAMARLDTLRDDNAGFFTLEGGGESFGVLSDLSLAELGLATLKGFTFEKIDATQAASKSRLILHRRTTAALPSAGALIILPPRDNRLVEVAGAFTQGTITRWDTSHPLMSYINPASLQLSHAFETFVRPMWMNDLIASSEGSIALSGEQSGGRYAVFGFELLPYEGAKSPLMSVMLLNALKWISNAAIDNSARPYQLREAPPDIVDARYAEDGGALAAEKSSPGFLQLKDPGLVVLRRASRVDLLAVQFFSDKESDLRAPQVVTVEQTRAVVSELMGKRTLVRRIALAVLLFLLVDIFLQIRRQRELRQS